LHTSSSDDPTVSDPVLPLPPPQPIKPVRVLLFDHTAQLGGGEIALAELVKRFDPKRVNPVILLGSDGPLRALLEEHLAVQLLPMKASVASARKDSLGITSLGNLATVTATLGYILRLARFIQHEEIEILHTNSLKAAIIGGFAGRLKGRKVIWHIRDRITEDYLPRKAVLAVRWLAKILPHFVIGNSLATLRTLDLPRTPSAVVPSGVDLSKFFPSDETPELSPGSTSHGKIGLVGRICPWKGQHIFIEAAAIVHTRWPQVRFLIVGAALFDEHDYELELRRTVDQLGLNEVIQFTGFQSDIAAIVRSLDILVHASVIGEPFGQVIVQGMACAVPVVATNGGGVPETVMDGDTGILVPMADASAMAEAISALIADPIYAHQMGIRGRQRVIDHFSIEESVRRVTESYEQVAERPSRPF
jgi:glycosyltransferase involved in cell wall biosynthesis